MRTFIGGDSYLPGVPARDLSDDEWNALPAETQEAADRLKLYAKAKADPAEKSDAPAAPVKESRNGSI